MTLWLILAITGRIGASTISSVLQKRLFQRDWSPTMVVTLSLSLLSLLLLPIAIFYADSVADLPAEFWYAILLSAILDASGNVLLVRAIGSGELSVIGPLNSYKPLFGLLLGVLWLGDRPEWLGIFGVLIILVGSWLLAVPKVTLFERGVKSPESASSIDAVSEVSPNELARRKQSQFLAIRDRFGSIVLTASASIFLKQAINTGGELLAFCGWAVGCTLFLWIVVLFQGANQELRLLRSKMDRQSMKWFAWLVISYLSLQAITVWIFGQMSVGYALALFQLGSIVQVFLGWHYFGERQLLRRLFASAVMTAGAICVILSR